jgi:outer membrane lipoprotein SlyB
MSVPRLATRLPVVWPGLAAALLLATAAVARAQGTLNIDPRDPALYREPARAGACRVCGEVRSIREVRAEPNRNASGPGNQMVFGAVVLLPFGPGGKEDPYVGGVGTQDMAERLNANSYEILIRMDSGEQVVMLRRDGASFRVGERVTVSGGLMAPL